MRIMRIENSMMRRISLLPFLLLPFLLIYSCGPNGKSGAAAIDPDDTLSGRQIIAINPDSTPKIVYYYPTDEQGNAIGPHNREIHYLPGKKKYVEGGVQNEKRNGEWKSYFEDGTTLRSIANYKEDELNGDYKVFHENGKTAVAGHYTNGKCDGKWTTYDVQGNIIKEITTDENSIGCNGCPKCRTISMKSKQ